MFMYKETKQRIISETFDSNIEDYDQEIDQNEMQESVYKKRKVYSQYDLVEFYEGVRFTLPFMIYRKIEWWNTLDIIAQYSNIFVTGIYAYVAFFMQVNLFSCINLFFLGYFFFSVTKGVGYRTQIIQKSSNVQSQCDIRMAKMVTKRYK
jgi:hypothetical protein